MVHALRGARRKRGAAAARLGLLAILGSVVAAVMAAALLSAGVVPAGAVTTLACQSASGVLTVTASGDATSASNPLDIGTTGAGNSTSTDYQFSGSSNLSAGGCNGGGIAANTSVAPTTGTIILSAPATKTEQGDHLVFTPTVGSPVTINNVTLENGFDTVTAPGGFPGVTANMSVSDSDHGSAISGGTTVSTVPVDTVALNNNATASSGPSGISATFETGALAATVTGSSDTATLVAANADVQPGMTVVLDTDGCFTGHTVVSNSYPGTTITFSTPVTGCITEADTITFGSTVSHVSTISGSPDITSTVDGGGGFPDVFPGMTVAAGATGIAGDTVTTFATTPSAVANGSPNAFVLSANATSSCADSLTFSATVSNITTSSSSTLVTVTSGGFPGVVAGMDVTSAASNAHNDIQNNTYVDWVNGNTLNLSQNAAHGDSASTLIFSTHNTISADTVNLSQTVIAPGGFPDVVTGMTVTDPGGHCFNQADTVTAVGTSTSTSLPLSAADNAGASSITLTFATTVGNVSTTNHSANVTAGNSASFPDVVSGMSVSGTDIPTGTTVSSINANTLTLSANATGNNTGTLTFSTSVAAVTTTTNSFLATDSGGFPSVTEGMTVSGAFSVSVDPTVVITGSASTNYVVINNQSGNLASAAAGCVPQFQLEFPTAGSPSDTLVVQDDNTSPGTGDDSVAVTSAVAGGETSEGITLSEGACSAADITVPAGNEIPTLDVLGENSSGNVLDLSGNTASSMTINANGDVTPAAVSNVTTTSTSTTISVTSGGFPNVFDGMTVTDTAGCIPVGDTVSTYTSGANSLVLTPTAATCNSSTDVVTFSSLGNVTGMPGSVSVPVNFSGVQTIDGASAGTDFSPGTASQIAFDGVSSVTNTLDLSGEPALVGTNLTANVNGDSSGSPGSLTGNTSTSSGAVAVNDSFFGIAAVKGTPGGSTTFQPGTAASVSFTGGSSATNTIDLTGEAAGNFSTLTADMTVSCTGGTGQLTGVHSGSTVLSDCFSNVQRVFGASSVPTTFQPGNVSGVTFAGGSNNGTLDLSGEVSPVSGLRVAMNGNLFSSPGDLTGNLSSGTITDTVYGLDAVLGSPTGTTFQPGSYSNSVTFSGSSSATNNSLDLGNETFLGPTSVTVTENSASCGGNGSVNGDCFSNVASISGVSSGTTISATQAGGTTLTASGGFPGVVPGMTVTGPDLTFFPPYVVVSVSGTTLTLNNPTVFAGTFPDTFSAATTDEAVTFQPGTTDNVTFTGGPNTSPNTNTIDLGSESASSFSNFTVAMNTNCSTGTGEVTGVKSSSTVLTDCFSNVKSVKGATAVATTFQPGTVTGATFGGGANNGTLDLSGENGSASGLAVTVNGNTSSNPGELTGTSTANTSLTDSVYGLDAVVGSPNNTTFQPGSATGVSFSGANGATNGLVLGNESLFGFTGLTVAMTSASCSGGGQLTGTGSTSLTECFSNVSSVSSQSQPSTVSGVTANGTSTITDASGFPGVVTGMIASGGGITGSPTVVSINGTSLTLTGTVPAGSGLSIAFAASTSDVPTTFQPGTVTNVTFTGGANAGGPNADANTLDLTSESASSFSALTVAMSGTVPCNGAGQGKLTSASGSAVALTDCFSSVKTVNGANAVATTFQPGTGAVTGVAFAAAAGNGILDLSGESGSATGLAVSVNQDSTVRPGNLTGTASGAQAIADSFSGVDSVVGSPNGTNFQPGSATGVSFSGAGGATNNLILGNEAQTPISVSSFTVAMTSASCSGGGQLSGTATPNISDCFSNVSAVSGVSQPATVSGVTENGTTTVTDAAGFPGVVPGMVVSGTGISGGPTVVSVSGESLTLSPSTVGSGTGITLTFAASTSDVPTTFQPGTVSGVNFTGGPNTGGTANSLDLTSESAASFKSLIVSMSSTGPCVTKGPGELSSGSGSSVALTDCFSNVTSVTGATAVPTTFQPGTVNDVIFSGGTGSGVVNTIDLTSEPSSTFTGLSVAMTATCPVNGSSNQGVITGTESSSTLTDCFSNTTQVNGSNTVNTVFQAGHVNGVTFTGGTGSGVQNEIDLSGETTAFFGSSATFTVSMTGSSPCSSSGGELFSSTSSDNITDCFSAVSTVLGAQAPTTFQPGTTTGVTFGDGSANGTLDLSAENAGAHLTVNMATNTSGSPSTEGSLTGTSSSGSALSDLFYGVVSVLGSPNGTDFQPGTATGVTFTGEGGSGNNEVDLSKESSTSYNSITVAMDSATAYTPTVANASVTGTSTAVTVVSGGFPGVFAGMSVTGSGIPGGDKVASVSGNTLTLTAMATGAGTVIEGLSFADPAGCSPATGEGAIFGGQTSGTPNLLDDCYFDVGQVNGTPSGVVTVFEPDPTLSTTPSPVPLFIGNNPSSEADVVDLSQLTSSSIQRLTAELNGDSSSSVGTVSATVSGNPVTFASFYRADEILGGTQPTTFRPDLATNVDLVGQSAAANSLDLSDENAGSFGSSGVFNVTMATTSASCATGEGQVTGTGSIDIADCFLDVTTVDGSPLQTTFVPDQIPTTPATLFVGGDSNPQGSIVSLSDVTTGSGVTVALGANTTASPGDVAPTVGGTAYTNFAGVNEVVASTAVPTDFQPGSSPAVLLAGTTTKTDVLDLSAETSPATGITVTANNDSSGLPGVLSGTSSSDTTLNDQFFGISTVLGSPQGTTLALGPALPNAITFDGWCSGTPANVLDLTSATSALTVAGSETTAPGTFPPNTYACASEAEAALTLGHAVSAYGITEIKGSSSAATTYQAGSATGVQFVGQGTNSNTLDLSGTTSGPYTVNMVSGTFSGPTSGSFQDVDAVLGSPGGTTFDAAATGGVTFTGEDSTLNGDVLALPSDGSLLTVNVNGDTSGNPGAVTGLSQGFSNQTTDSFTAIGQFDGNTGVGGTTFVAAVVAAEGANPVVYSGGSGPTTLSFASVGTGNNASNALLIDLVHTVTINSIPYNGASLSGGSNFAAFKGITAFTACATGSSCQSTTIEPAAATTASFTGSGSNNVVTYGGIASGQPGVSVTESSGTGSATPGGGGTLSFSDVQSFVGSPNADIFSVGAGSVAINGNGGADEATLINDPQGITFTSTYNGAGPTEHTTIATSTGTNTVTEIPILVGSSSGQNTFISNGVGGYTYQAGGSGNSLDLSQSANSATLSGVTVNATGNCSPNCVTNLAPNGVFANQTEDFFSGIQTFTGPTAGGTTFDSSGASGVTFNGKGQNDVLNLSTAPTNTQVQDSGCAGTVIDGSNSSSFSDIAQLVGSTSGSTSFVGSGSAIIGSCATQGSPPVTFVGQGSGNKLDLSALPTSSGSVGTVTVSSSGVGTTFVGATDFETFQGIQTFTGSLNGFTNFVTGSVGGFTFTGQGSSNSLSFAPSASTVQVFLNPNSQGEDVADPGSGSDNFTGFSKIIGSPANNNIFFAGPGNFTILGGGGSNDEISYASASNPTVFSVASGTATITGGFSGTTTTTGVTTFVGSGGGANTFDADSYGGYSFQAPTGTTGNALSFQGEESTTGVTTLGVSINTTTGNGTVSGLDSLINSSTGDTFSGIQSFTGTPLVFAGVPSNSFKVGAGTFTLTAPGTGTNTLSFSPASVGVDVNLTGGVQTVTSGGSQVNDIISGFESFTGSAVGGNTFNAPQAGGYEFVGQSSGNTLDLSVAPAGISVTPNGDSLASLGTVTGLNAGSGPPPGDSGAGNMADTFAGIQVFNGSGNSSVPTTFVPGCAGGEQFNGEGQGTVLDLSLIGCTGSAKPLINASSNPGTITGLPGGGGQDTFTGIATFEGPSTGDTTFIAPGSSLFGLDFIGSNGGNTFDASNFPSGAVLDDTSGVATLGSDQTDTFSAVSCFVGSSAGNTTFLAPTAQLSTAGCSEHANPPNFLGTGSGNTLSLNALNTTSSAAVVTAPTGVVTVGGSQWDTFASVQTLLGSGDGNTTFVGGTTGGFNFEGAGTASTNTMSFGDIPATGGGVQIDLDPNTQGQQVANPGSGTDTFTGISNVIGSQASDTILGGPGTWTVNGDGGNDTLNYSAAPNPLTVSLLNGAGTVTGGFPGQTTTTTRVTTFIGSATGSNSFTTDSYGGYAFDAPTGTTGNSLSFASVESGVGVSGVTVGVNSSSGNGTASGLVCQVANPPPSCTADSFQDIQSYQGSKLSDHFSVGAGSFTLLGGTSGTNTLSFASAPAGVNVDLAQPTPTATSSGGQVNDTLGNFETITGATVGGNTFEVPAGGGYQLIGGGSGNTLNLGATQPAAPNGIALTVNGDSTSSLGTVTGLKPGVGPVGSNTQDTFAQMATFVGSSSSTPTAPVTFEASCTGGLTFTGAGRATSFDVASTGTPACPSDTPTIDAISPGTVSGLPGGQDSFSAIQTFTGPTSGDTTFIAPGQPNSGLTFVGQSAGNVLDASAFPSGAVLDSTSGTATLGPSSTDAFSGMSCFVGSSAGSTTFRAPAGALSPTGCAEHAGQPDYLATGNNNTLDLSAVPTASGSQATVSNGNVTVGAGSFGTYVDIVNFVGPTTGFATFIAAPGPGQTFTGQGTASTDTLSIPSAPHSTVIDTTSGTVTLGGNTGTLNFSGIGAFIGSASGVTTFRPDALHSYSFTGVAATTGNVLDLTNAPHGIAVDLACTQVVNSVTVSIVVMTSSPPVGCAAPPPNSIVDTFSGMQSYMGSQFGSTAFTAPTGGTGGLSFTGQGGSGNSLSYSALPPGPGVNIDLLHGTVAYPVWGSVDTFSGLQTLTGSRNADTFQGGPVTATLVGGGGSDTLSFADANTSANVTLAIGAGTGVATGGFVGTPAQLTLIGIQNVVSSPFGGTVTGNNLPSVFTGGSGANDFVVVGGTDVIDGGGGQNTLDLSHATKFVTLNLGVAGPQVTGGDGILTVVPGTISNVIGGNFGNRLIGGPGNVTLNGGVGTDWLQAGSGTDFLNAGSGPSTLVGGTGYDTMTGGAGSDTFIPGTGGGKIVDTAGVGTLDYALATSSVNVNIGNTAYTTPNGKTTLPPDEATGGGATQPELLVGLQNIIGSNHGDILVGNTGSNTITGGTGTNLIVGNGGGDVLSAGAGVNVFITGSGNNTVRGGAGVNTIDYAGAPAAVNVNLAKDTAKNGYGGTDTLIGITNIIGSSNGGDVLALGPHGGEVIAGNGNNDTLTGSSGGGSTMIGGGGIDTFTSSAAGDHMIGGGGDDTFLANNGFVDYMTGGSGYNIAYVDCIDVKDKTYTNINELHLPAGGCSSSGTPTPTPPKKPVPTPTKTGGPHGGGSPVRVPSRPVTDKTTTTITNNQRRGAATATLRGRPATASGRVAGAARV